MNRTNGEEMEITVVENIYIMFILCNQQIVVVENIYRTKSERRIPRGEDEYHHCEASEEHQNRLPPGSHCLPSPKLGIGDDVANDILNEDLEDVTTLLVDEAAGPSWSPSSSVIEEESRRKGNEGGKSTKSSFGKTENLKSHLGSEDTENQFLLQTEIGAERTTYSARVVEPSTCLGFVSPVISGPKDPISRTDPERGEVLHHPNQTSREVGNSRASRARNWKRRARQSYEHPTTASGKDDAGKRKADDQRWNEVSDEQDGTKKRHRLEAAHEGTYVYCDTAAADPQPRRSP
ncbi:hypothetical protein U1Q18_045040 [Sarracenia purpurea var. burkii]